MNKILFCGAVLGLLSVIMAAYVDHGLSSQLTEHQLKSIATALRYHQLYAVIISIIGLLISSFKLNRIVTIASYLFVLGIFLFSFDIYMAILFNYTWMMSLVPVGGFILMLGWCGLIASSFMKREFDADLG